MGKATSISSQMQERAALENIEDSRSGNWSVFRSSDLTERKK